LTIIKDVAIKPNLEEIVKKHYIDDKKQALIKQVEHLRVKKGLLKEEYIQKKTNIKENWVEIENTPVRDKIPK
jgi:hypothetical protein